MNYELIEEELAYLLVVHATELLEGLVQNPGDLDAAICATLARAMEVASNKKLKPIDEIFQPKSL
jgi:hypothetical protein